MPGYRDGGRKTPSFPDERCKMPKEGAQYQAIMMECAKCKAILKEGGKCQATMMEGAKYPDSLMEGSKCQATPR